MSINTHFKNIADNVRALHAHEEEFSTEVLISPQKFREKITEPNLKSENIVEEVSIFGVTGNYVATDNDSLDIRIVEGDTPGCVKSEVYDTDNNILISAEAAVPNLLAKNIKKNAKILNTVGAIDGIAGLPPDKITITNQLSTDYSTPLGISAVKPIRGYMDSVATLKSKTETTIEIQNHPNSFLYIYPSEYPTDLPSAIYVTTSDDENVIQHYAVLDTPSTKLYVLSTNGAKLPSSITISTPTAMSLGVDYSTANYAQLYWSNISEADHYTVINETEGVIFKDNITSNRLSIHRTSLSEKTVYSVHARKSSSSWPYRSSNSVEVDPSQIKDPVTYIYSVTVKNSDGAAVPNATVKWMCSQGLLKSGTTNNNGVASISRTSLFTYPYYVEVSHPDYITATTDTYDRQTFSVTVTLSEIPFTLSATRNTDGSITLEWPKVPTATLYKIKTELGDVIAQVSGQTYTQETWHGKYTVEAYYNNTLLKSASKEIYSYVNVKVSLAGVAGDGAVEVKFKMTSDGSYMTRIVLPGESTNNLFVAYGTSLTVSTLDPETVKMLHVQNNAGFDQTPGFGSTSHTFTFTIKTADTTARTHEIKLQRVSTEGVG